MIRGAGCVVLLFFLGALQATATETGVALLGELVPWMMMSTTVVGRILDLTGAPAESLDGSAELPFDAEYGSLALGNSDDAVISVVIRYRPGESPLLLVDAENNETVGDDLWREPTNRESSRAYSWDIQVMVEYDSATTTVRVPYQVTVNASYSYVDDEFEWTYGGTCHRKGILSVGGSEHSAAIASLDTTADYSDITSVAVAIDLDGDGEINTLPFSRELFGPGRPLALPTGLYSITRISPDGLRMEVERIGEPVARPVIGVGESAPRFSATATDGTVIAVSDVVAVPLILAFAGAPRGSTCPECTASQQFSLPERFSDLLQGLSDMRAEVRVIVLTDQDVPHDFEIPLPRATDPFTIHVVHSPAVIELYRRNIGVVIADRDGMIVALDEPWSHVVNGRPLWNIDYLTEEEILAIVSRL